MYRVVLRSMALLLPILAAQPALAEYGVWVDGQNMRSPFMRVYGESRPPIGYIKFCHTFPGDCLPQQENHARISLSLDLWRELLAVNSRVNKIIEPTSDQDLYGEVERWTYPKTKGDCEDYVLLKRRMLMERGWSASALLITVVTDEKGEGHAVLTVRTKDGDFVLDNKNSKVLAWNEVPYRFYKRQSYRDPRLWVSLKPQRDIWQTPSTSNR